MRAGPDSPPRRSLRPVTGSDRTPASSRSSMETLVILILLLVFVVFPGWVIFKLHSLGKENDALASHLLEVQREVRELRERTPPAAAPTSGAGPAPTAAVPVVPRAAALPSHREAAPAPHPPPPPPATAPAVPAIPVSPPPPIPPPVFAAQPARSTMPPPLPAAPTPAQVLNVPSWPARIDWEQFMGAKLFAWLGGLAALLGVAFFVKYSFEHDWIPPEVRIALGFLFAAGLIVGGLKIDRERYAATAQTLCATGVVSLYAVTFACNSVYHFSFFGMVPTFLLMALITAAAFLLAVRLEARVVAVLGMLGGFLTPVLLSTGRDNPPGLFGYIALLNVGLIAVALHRGWSFLVGLGAAGTIAMQLGWAEKFLNAAKAPTAMIVCLAFCALFFAAYLVARRFVRGGAGIAMSPGNAPEGQENSPTLRSPSVAFVGSAIAFPFVAFAFAFVFLFYPAIAMRPGLLFAFVLAADAFLLAIAWFDEDMPKLHLVAGVAVFTLLAAWTGGRLTEELLPWALAFYLLHAVMHTAFPLLLERHRPAAAPTWWSQLFPPLALLLMLGPLFKLDAVSLLFWPCVLLVDLIAIALAFVTASLTAVAVVLVLTLAATALWIFQVPVATAVEPSLLVVIGGFAVLFFAAGILLARKLRGRLADGVGFAGNARAQIPAFSALLPFLLLIMITQRLPLANPSPVFGLALLLVALTLGLAFVFTLEWLPACALAGVAALEYSWHARHFSPAEATLPLAWYVLFHGVITVYPFVFRRRFASLAGPWAIAALAGVAQFPLVYRTIERAWPNEFLGLVPALFAVPPLAGLGLILRAPTANERARLNQLAWFGGVALLFITLIFPIQFERQWITVGWALEGAALLWLFHRVPHPALRATGAVLLVASFARLALNPAVLAYHTRADTPLLNWYLYSYGLVIACLFVAARLTAPPRHEVLGVNVPPLFTTLGTILAFLLLNLEIADYFSSPGARVLTFQFSGNFARDMTYTIAWALFALGLLLVGIWKQTRAGRYAALGLLGIALLKLFFHDLARLEALYRIGALFAVAVIAIVASFVYQRFLPGQEKNAADQP